MRDGGYVIVSPDDRSTAVLGYSDHGKIDPEAIPECMRAWLQGYAEETAQLYGQSAADGSATAVYRNDIEPMVRAVFGQDTPYNDACPRYGGQTCLTGCVATALAQVMYCHQHPAATTGEIPAYTTSSLGIGQSAVPKGTAIAWNDILPVYGQYNNDGNGWRVESYTATQADAVAGLMSICGKTVRMDYMPNSSGGISQLIAPALVKYFGYNRQTVQPVSRSNYTDSQWTEIIYHELAHRRPVIYSGVTGSNAGHAFVIDGYQGDDYFHVNWGLPTMECDGYYKLSAMNPRNIAKYTSNGFNYRQQAVIGIEPASSGGSVSDEVSRASGSSIRLIDIQWSENPVRTGGSVDITATVQNNSVTPYTKGFVFIPSTQSTFSSSDIIPATVSSGETVSITKNFSVSGAEGEVVYALVYYHTGYDSWYIDETFFSEPLVVSGSAAVRTVSRNTAADGAYYSLDGRRTHTPKRGLYITGGKKLVVRNSP